MDLFGLNHLVFIGDVLVNGESRFDELLEGVADGSLTRKLDGQPQYLPLDKDHTRVASLQGFWRFVPQGDGKVEVTYQVHTEPGGSVPSWLANSFVVDAPFNTLSGLRTLAEKR